jgi:hypothetical protein
MASTSACVGGVLWSSSGDMASFLVGGLLEHFDNQIKIGL